MSVFPPKMREPGNPGTRPNCENTTTVAGGYEAVDPQRMSISPVKCTQVPQLVATPLAVRNEEDQVFDITSYYGNYISDGRPVDYACQNSCEKECARRDGYKKWRTILTLTRDEFIVETKTETVGKFGTESSRNDKQVRPYAHLGSVDLKMDSDLCNCCVICFPITCPWQVWSVETNGIQISPGWGSDEALVRQIADELQIRKISRGNIQLIKLSERTGCDLDVVSSWVDAVLEKQGAEAVNDHVEAHKIRSFEDKEYIVTPLKGQICCQGLDGPTTWCWATWPDDSICAPTVVTLKLEEEEAVLETKAAWSFAQLRRPYAQLGSVNVITDEPHVCCESCPGNDPNFDYCAWEKVGHRRVGVDSWTITPGFESDVQMIQEIADELQNRKVGRGNIAQLNEAYRSARVVGHMKANISSLMKSMEVTKPHDVHSAQAMERI